MGVAEAGKLRSMSMMRWSSDRASASCDWKLAQRELVGQDAVPQQVGGFFEGRVLGQLVNVDAAIGQHARVSVDPADAGVRRDNSFQTLSSDSSRHSLWISPLQ